MKLIMTKAKFINPSELKRSSRVRSSKHEAFHGFLDSLMILLPTGHSLSITTTLGRSKKQTVAEVKDSNKY